MVYNIKVVAAHDKIICSINNSIVIKLKDSYRISGKIALYC